tara:strand:+ start:1206 stop:2849 length:1644 start_codon:yes stop_codon:yes gene_type:complete
MDKLLGQVFDEYIDKQIKVRQNSLGKPQKSTADLQVFNSSTPWIRLTSAVTIGPKKAQQLATNLGIGISNIQGNQLAKNLVLFAGSSTGVDATRRGGVGYGLDNAYGFLSDKEQGYKPMPGVTGISTTYKNNGSLKQAQVTLTCFTRMQFEALEALYLRLGYSVILEWGHSMYFDNKGEKQNMSSLSIPNMLFNSNKDIAASKVHKNILLNKTTTGGNYDGMLAKVSNFSWSLNSDLSYSITLDLISVGDIIDSLKMNIGATDTNGEDLSQVVNVEVSAGVQNITSIEIDKNTSKLNTFLFDIVSELTSKEVQSEYSRATQDQLVFKNLAIAARANVRKVRERYLEVIKALIENTSTNFLAIQGILSENPNPTYVPTKFGPRFTFIESTAGDKQKLLELLEAGGYTLLPKFGYVVKQNGKLTFGKKAGGLSFYNFFGFYIQEDTAKPGIATLKVKSPPDPHIAQVQELRDGLVKIEKFFQGLAAISTGDADTDNIKDIEFLQATVDNVKEKETVTRLLAHGFLDKDEKFEYKDLEISTLAVLRLKGK